MLRNHPLVARLLPRLAYQLVPAVLVTTVGVLLLSNLGKGSAPPPAAVPVEAAISTEAVFKIIPRETAEAPADAKRSAPRSASQKPPTPPSRKPANEPAAPREVASAPAPLPIVQIPDEPQPVTPADSDNAVVSKLRSATTAVQRLPQWAARSVAGWFAAEAPPRPPASVPSQAAM